MKDRLTMGMALLGGLMWCGLATAGPPSAIEGAVREAAPKRPPAEAPAPPKAEPEATKFLRVTRDRDRQPLTLETAIVRYVPESGEGGVAVDLVAAVHLGEKSYYRELNKRFADYDVVLYELVAEKGTRIPKGGRPADSPLSALMKSGLDLDLQVERIDYTAENFVHADLSPKEMGEAMRKRGEDGVTLTLSVIADAMRQANLQQQRLKNNPPANLPEISLSTLLFDPEGPLKLKRFMAEQFVVSDGMGGLGPTLNRLLIEDRNKAAAKVFQKELAGGRKKIAIFYGAAHMPDFEKRLVEDFGLKRSGTEWVTAWDLE